MRYKILICEDNEKNRKLMKDILDYHGFEVFLAGNGIEGIKMAQEIIPDLILMDMQMPEMDGSEAIKKIRNISETRHIKIIVITSFAMVADKEKALLAGADYYLTKPINTRTLPSLIRSIIEKGTYDETKDTLC